IKVTKNPHEGHRKRLRERFKKSGLAGFHDYEFIELLLTYAIPQKDVKPLAKELLSHFGGIRGIFDASLEELTTIKGLGERTAILFKLLKEGSTLYLKERVKGKEILSSLQQTLDFCYHMLSGEKNEKFMVLYLTTKNELIDTEILEEGTINQTAVYPRKVVEGALKHNASALIFVHNHPSGDPTPSRTDKKLTEALVDAAQAIDLTVHDHIIIGKNSHFSGREGGWLGGSRSSSPNRASDWKNT
ncbi:MAG: DNA repair protein RadC, partial [Thermodesulfobacteriota bacterium]|nr:DNA repair protein RadC [Thermodesulfobacteriota bacterium]